MRVKIYLLRVFDAAEEYKRASTAEAGAPGTETILLVEDSEQLRELAREFLESRG